MRASPAPLNWGQLLSFSAPIFAFSGEELAFKVFLPTFLAQQTNVPLATLALILVIFRVWDTINDPLIGWVSDRWTWGHKRFSLMLIGAPLAMIGTGLVFLMPKTLGPLGLGLALCLAALGWTLVNVPHGAWALEYSKDPQERTRIFASRNLVGLMALPVFALGPGLLEQISGLDAHRDAIILIGIMVITLPLGLGLLGQHMLPRQLQPPIPPGPIGWQDIGPAFFSPSGIRLIWLFACLGAHTAILNTLTLFWVRLSLNLPHWGWTLILAQTLMGFATLPLWLWARQRLGTPRALGLSLGISLLVSLGVLGVPPKSVPALCAYGLLSASNIGASFLFLRTLLGQHLDKVVAKHNRAMAGMIYTGFHLAYNLAGALAGGASLWILSAQGFDPRRLSALGPTAAKAVIWIMSLGAALPMALALGGMVWMIRPRPTRKVFSYIRSKLLPNLR